jgi:predicted small lipoprotein YifL
MTETGRPLFRFALIVAFAATLGLTACGRKGPLDPPPAASAPAGGVSASGDAAGTAGEDEAPRPHAPAKRIPLDVLLN